MGDDKQYTIQIKGTAYKFRPLPPEDLERVVMIQSLSVSQGKVVTALTRVLANSAGVEQWDAITDRYIAGEIAVQEFTVDVFRKLIKRQGKDAEPAPVEDEDDGE